MKSLIRSLTSWLLGTVFIISILQWTLFISYHWIEYGRNPAKLTEELEEIGIAFLILFMGLPLVIGSTILILRRYLAPLKDLTRQAMELTPAGQPVPIKTKNDYAEIYTLSHALNQAFQKYENVLEQARRFSADASHQLRTPLAVMRSEGEVTLSKARSDEDYREALSSMLEETGHLERTVEQLQVLAHLDRGESGKLTAIDPQRIMDNLKERFDVIAESQQTAFHCTTCAAPVLAVNNVLLTEALANLLDNAFHAVGKEGRVDLTMSLGEEDLCFTVSDSGPGIPDLMRDQIFDRFHRAGNATYEGSGLGLSIASAIAEQHGGTLKLLDTPEHGASFLLCIPIIKPASV